MRRVKGPIELAGYSLPAGCLVITSPWLMARNPKHFVNPDLFQPSRWGKPINRFAFFPFSHGPRVCKGEFYVRTLLYALLTELSQRAYELCSPLSFDEHFIGVSAIPATKVAVGFE
jgi:cytochrome P450